MDINFIEKILKELDWTNIQQLLPLPKHEKFIPTRHGAKPTVNHFPDGSKHVTNNIYFINEQQLKELPYEKIVGIILKVDPIDMENE